MSDSKWCEHNAVRAECLYCEFEAMQARLAAERARADAAEQERDHLRELRHNDSKLYNELAEKCDAAERDAERYKWARDILTDGPQADEKALRLAAALMRGLDGDAAIDAARKENPHD